MISTQLNDHERIIKTKVDLNRSYPFFSYILMNMNIENTKSTTEVPTMAVNQFGDLYWNKDFVASLDMEELKFCLCHEAMHISTLTFQRKGLRDMGLWNIATDLLINFMLQNEGFRAPKGVLIPDHRGIYTFKSGKDGKSVSIDLNEKNAEQVYDELQKNSKVVKGSTKMQADGQYEGQVGKHLESDKDSEGKEQGKNKTEADGKANEQAWRRKITEASTQAKMRGNLSAQMERLLNKILEPVVDWRTVLFNYITNYLPIDYSMRLPSRRSYSTGVYSPIVIKENLEVIIGVDVSGSIGEEEYVQFMSECIGIADSFTQIKMRVIAWAVGVLEEDDIVVTNDTKADLLKAKFKNSGGTDLSSFTKYCEKKGYKSKVYVILTDGYVESNPKLPQDGDILFVISKNGTKDNVKEHGIVVSTNDVK